MEIFDNLQTKDINFNKSIIIKDVKFKYPHSENYVIDKFNLEIYAGEKMGIVGKSGSGKTTLINLISGLLKPVMEKFTLTILTYKILTNHGKI